MREFLENAANIAKNIKHLQGYVDILGRYTAQKENSILSEKEEVALDNKITELNELFTNLSNEIKVAIKKSQAETLKLKKGGASKGNIDMRELHTFRHSRDLAATLRNYQSMQCDHRHKENEKLKETYLIANPDATEEELERLADGIEGEALLASAFALGSHSAQGILIQAKNRKKRIDKIVETINTLVQLIEDIDKVVKKNTHVVDQIVVNMTAAEAHTTQATHELTSALYYERRAMRLKRLLALVFFVIIVVLILYLFRDPIFNRRRNRA